MLYPEWIDKYAQTLYDLLKTHDTEALLPFNGFNFYPLFDDLWINKIHKAIQKYNESEFGIEDIIKYLPTHSSLKFNLLEIIIDLKTAHTDTLKAKKIVDFFVTAIKARAVADDWVNDNRIIDYKDADKIIKEKNLIKADRSLAVEVAKLTAGCGCLVHGLYNDFCTDFGYDVFGPYVLSNRFGKHATLFVRHFLDLKACDIWPKRHDGFPYETIKIHSAYNNVIAKSHYMGCHMVYEQSLIDNLAYFQVEIDGKFVNSLDELRNVKDVVLADASSQYVKYKNLGFEEHKRIWLWQLCYQFKDFFGKMGVDWRPSDEMINRVKNKKLISYISSFDFSFDECCEKCGINNLKHIYGNNEV